MKMAFTFDLLLKEDIVKLMKSFFPELDMREDDLINPQKERWMKHYTQILVTYCGTTPEILHNYNSMIYEVEYPELCEDTFPYITVSQCMSRLLKATGIDDFGLADVMEPKKKSLRRHMSGLVNFVQFYHTRRSMFEKLQEDNRSKVDERRKMEHERDELKRRINAIKAERAEQEPQVAQIKEDIARITDANQSKVQSTEATRMENNRMKESVGERRAEISRLRVKVTTLKEEDAKLSSQIVPSPERLRTDIARQHQDLENLKHSKADMMQRLMDMKLKSELQVQRNQQCDQALRLLNTIVDKIEAEKKMQEQVAAIHDEEMQLHQSLQQLELEQQKLSQQIMYREERLEKAKLQHSAKVDSKRSEMTSLAKKLGQLTSANEEVAQMSAELAGLQAQQAALVQQHRAKTVAYREMYARLLGDLDKYHNNLGQKFQQVLIAGQTPDKQASESSSLP